MKEGASGIMNAFNRVVVGKFSRASTVGALFLLCSAMLPSCQPADGGDTKPVEPRAEVELEFGRGTRAFPPRFFDRHLVTWGRTPATSVRITFGVLNLEQQKKANLRIRITDTPLTGESLTQVPGTQGSSLRLLTPTLSTLHQRCQNPQQNLYEVIVNDLKPDTTYYYTISSDTGFSPELYFRTAPLAHNAVFKLLSGGDSRTDRIQRQKTNLQIADLVSSDPQYLALIHGGDFIAEGRSCDQWERWRQDHDLTISRAGRVLPLIPTFGNHEAGGEGLFSTLFGDPGGQGRFYYDVTIGRIKVLVLNSEISVEGDQRLWLRESLQDALKNRQVVLPSYHRPAWPAHKTPAATAAWVPLWEQFAVPLVLESDGHTLKQTCRIFQNHCQESRGTIYVGEGGFAAPIRSAKQSHQWWFEGGYAYGQFHIQSLAFSLNSYTYSVFYDGAFHHELAIQ